MKYVTRSLAIFVVCAIVFSLAGCSSQQADLPMASDTDTFYAGKEIFMLSFPGKCNLRTSNGAY